MRKSKIFGFTLIELIMVIVILGIIASVTLPKFVKNFKLRSISASEDAIAGAMNTAIKAYNLSYAMAGGDLDVTYAFVNPFTLVFPTPPYTYAGYGASITPDGVTWRYNYHQSGLGAAYYIYCPHRDMMAWSASSNKGRCWVYKCYGLTDYFTDHRPGEFWLYNDYGH